MESRNTQTLAERIALLLQEEKQGSDESALRASLEKINQRLDKIESRLSAPSFTSPPAAASSGPIHASQERFTDLEELADEIIKNLQNEKACPYEPTGKPCDHCAMCSSRGF